MSAHEHTRTFIYTDKQTNQINKSNKQTNLSITEITAEFVLIDREVEVDIVREAEDGDDDDDDDEEKTESEMLFSSNDEDEEEEEEDEEEEESEAAVNSSCV